MNKQALKTDLLAMALIDRIRTVMRENPKEGGHSATDVLLILQEKEAVDSSVTVIDVADEMRAFFN